MPPKGSDIPGQGRLDGFSSDNDPAENTDDTSIGETVEGSSDAAGNPSEEVHKRTPKEIFSNTDFDIVGTQIELTKELTELKNGDKPLEEGRVKVLATQFHIIRDRILGSNLQTPDDVKSFLDYIDHNLVPGLEQEMAKLSDQMDFESDQMGAAKYREKLPGDIAKEIEAIKAIRELAASLPDGEWINPAQPFLDSIKAKLSSEKDAKQEIEQTEKDKKVKALEIFRTTKIIAPSNRSEGGQIELTLAEYTELLAKKAILHRESLEDREYEKRVRSIKDAVQEAIPPELRVYLLEDAQTSHLNSFIELTIVQKEYDQTSNPSEELRQKFDRAKKDFYIAGTYMEIVSAITS